MLALIEDFPKQIEEGWAIGRRSKILIEPFGSIHRIMFTGMGGSAIGADVLRNLMQADSPHPILVNRGYQLPRFVDRHTLVIASSYSGNTEETLSSFEEAVEKKAQILCISSGGRLGELARRKGIALMTIPGGFPPRAALAYSVFPLLYLFVQLGWSRIREEDLHEVTRVLGQLRDEKYGQRLQAKDNLAKRIARSLKGKTAVIYTSDVIDSAALRWRGQIEENAKAMAFHHLIPEMNHNEVVGWKEPQALLKKVVAIFLRDTCEHPRIKIRMGFTHSLVEEKGASVFEVPSYGRSLVARLFSLIYAGDFVSFYLAQEYGEDPTPVAVIDELKALLEEKGKTRFS